MKKKKVKVKTYLDPPSRMDVVVYDTKNNEVVALFTDAAFAHVFKAAVSKDTIEKYSVNWQSLKEHDLKFEVEEYWESPWEWQDEDL
jgi:peptide methionine sulfoxide reductase MsrB